MIHITDEDWNWAESALKFQPTKEKTMNEVAQNTTPTTVEIDPEFAELPEFLKQALQDGKVVEIQTEEEIGTTPTIH